MADAEIAAPPIRGDGLQLEEDRASQERLWTVERMALLVFAITVVVALLGFAGSGGPLADVTVEAGSGRIVHPRVLRWQTADRLEIVLTADRPRHEVVLAAPFSTWFSIETIQPRPEAALLVPRGLVLTFAADGAPRSKVVLEVRPDRPGLARYHIGIDGAEPTLLTQLVLP